MTYAAMHNLETIEDSNALLLIQVFNEFQASIVSTSPGS
jgi:hypothetical protein